MENMLLIAAKLYDWVSRYVLVFPPEVEVGEANGALGAEFAQVDVVFNFEFSDLGPEFLT